MTTTAKIIPDGEMLERRLPRKKGKIQVTQHNFQAMEATAESMAK
jgi:hypothetical protein